MERVSQVDPLAILIDLEKRVRSVLTLDELRFVFVNETHGLIPYRQAILFESNGNPLTHSGVAELEHGAPFALWLKKFISPIVRDVDKACSITAEDIDPSGLSDWMSWLPTYGFVQPLASPTGNSFVKLFLARNEAFSEADQAMLEILAGAYGHAWEALGGSHRKLTRRRSQKTLKLAFLIIILIVLALPVPLTVLAPAEIVAVHPAIIRSPVEGVVEKVFVEPNQEVRIGDMLFQMDAVSQRNEMAVAQKIYGSLKAQYAQLSRQALTNPESKWRLAETAGRLRQQKTRIRFFEDLIDRLTMSAPVNGSVIIDDPSSWTGRPVNLGEKIMSIADENFIEIEAWLSVSDAIDLPPGSPIRIYLNSDPLTPVDAVLRTYSYEAQSRLGGNYAYQIRGRILNKKHLPRLGLRGTARLEGEKVSIAYWIFRRPIVALRQFFGI